MTRPTGEDMAAALQIRHQLDAADGSRLVGDYEEQTEDLRSRLLQAYREWCERWGHSAEGWTIADDGSDDITLAARHGYLTNPIGVACTDREAVMTQLRISEMATAPKEEIVKALRLGWLIFEGKPTLRIVALWDGQLAKCRDDEDEATIIVAAGSDPAVLVCFEGEVASAGKWLEPLRVYRLLEHGYRLTDQPPEAELASGSARDEEIPF